MDCNIEDIFYDMEDDEDVTDPTYISQKIVDMPLPPINGHRKSVFQSKKYFNQSLSILTLGYKSRE